MKNIGIDLHKRIIMICVMNDKREVMERKRFSNDETDEMKVFFESQGKLRAVFEATGSYEWFYRLLEPLAEKVVLVHPKKLRVIAESTQKSDKVDAQVLALFLSLDMMRRQKVYDKRCRKDSINNETAKSRKHFQ